MPCEGYTDEILGKLTFLDWTREFIGEGQRLKQGDFAGLSGITMLDVSDIKLVDIEPGSFAGLGSVTEITLTSNRLATLRAGVFDDLPELTMIRLYGNQLSTVEPGVFAGLPDLVDIRMPRNQFTSLPDGMFSGVAALRSLRLHNNPGNPLALEVSLEQVGVDRFKAVAPAGAPFDIRLPLIATGGTLPDDFVTIPAGATESDVIALAAPTLGMTVALGGDMPPIPDGHTGYEIRKTGSDVQVTLAVGIASRQVRQIIGGERVSLAGVVDGAESDGSGLSFEWSQTGGPTVVLDYADRRTARFWAPVAAADAVLSFRFTVVDESGLSASADVEVTVLAADTTPDPFGFGAVADAPPGQIVESDVVTIAGINARTPLAVAAPAAAGVELYVDGDYAPLSTWVREGAEIELQARASATPGEAVTVTVTAGGVSADWVITTRPLAEPTADAGPNQTAAPGETVALTGAASSTPHGGPERLSFEWVQAFGPPVTLDDPASAAPSFVVPADAAHGAWLRFDLQVTDQNGLFDHDTVDVFVAVPEGTAPVANAGPNLVGAPGALVVLQGTGSVNPYGFWWKLAHRWTQTSGPRVVLDHPTKGNPGFIVPADAAEGTTLEFELTVVGKGGLTDTDKVTVTVAEGPVSGPKAEAGPDLSGAPGAPVTLQGRGSFNPYGKWWWMAHSWTQLSGPPVVLSDPTKGDPTFTVPIGTPVGTTLEFRLTVTDRVGNTDTDTTTVTVTA